MFAINVSFNLAWLRRCLLDAFSRRAFAERSGTSSTVGMPTDAKKDKDHPSDSVAREAMEHNQTLLRVGAHVYPKFRNGR